MTSGFRHRRRAAFALTALLLIAANGCGNDETAHEPDAGITSDANVGTDSTEDSGAQVDVTPGDAAGGDVQPWVLPDVLDLVSLVDPMIGTRGPGNVVPGPALPHGMVKLSPDSLVEEGSIDAYEYGVDRIEGFSHTHLEGPGGSRNGYSQILLTPLRGEIVTTREAYASAFSHDNETASPGYYAVTLDDPQADVELTATAHCGVHRYRFSGTDTGHILIDIGHSRGISRGGHVEIVGDDVVEGWGDYSVHPALAFAVDQSSGATAARRVYFHARFATAFAGRGTWKGATQSAGSTMADGADLGAWVTYDTPPADGVEVRVCISSIDVPQARTHAAAEVEGRSFEAVAEAASQEWNELLNRVRVEGGTEAQRRAFYTGLYHTFLQPADYDEDGRFWSGFAGEGRVHETEGWHFHTDDWCMWDTYRTTHPLQLLVEPETRTDIVQSLLHAYEEGGWLPKCTWCATGYSRVMIGNHAVPIIADAFEKGFRDYDTETAWDAVWKAATEDVDFPIPGVCGYFNLGSPADYLTLGYVPDECDQDQGASMTLEYAYNDAVAARFGAALGRDAEATELEDRAGSFAAHWDSDSGFMRPRQRDGAWVEPFDPEDWSDRNGFCEASAWVYTWFVPHDVPRLIELMGGAEAFLSKLDEYFDTGQHDPSNEPGFHVPYLYVYAGDPSRTQARVRALLDAAFSDEPNGLPGNDDAGATSAWYVFSAMGLFPAAPGDDVYTLTSPTFDRVELLLHPAHRGGERFAIETRNGGDGRIYIQSATLNGVPLDRAWLRHSEIVAGGELVLEMGADPSDWAADAPPPALIDF